MRALWIALLIALLPLRGWMGDAMAVSMAAAPIAVAVGQSAMGDDCHHQASMAEAHGSAHAVHAGGHEAPHDGDLQGSGHEAHLMCDVCNGPALGSRVALPAPGAATHGLLIARSERFASLAPRHLIKPPIA
jgi:hypothetical protein